MYCVPVLNTQHYASLFSVLKVWGGRLTLLSNFLLLHLLWTAAEHRLCAPPFCTSSQLGVSKCGEGSWDIITPPICLTVTCTAHTSTHTDSLPHPGIFLLNSEAWGTNVRVAQTILRQLVWSHKNCNDPLGIKRKSILTWGKVWRCKETEKSFIILYKGLPKQNIAAEKGKRDPYISDAIHSEMWKNDVKRMAWINAS